MTKTDLQIALQSSNPVHCENAKNVTNSSLRDNCSNRCGTSNTYSTHLRCSPTPLTCRKTVQSQSTRCTRAFRASSVAPHCQRIRPPTRQVLRPPARSMTSSDSHRWRRSGLRRSQLRRSGASWPDSVPPAELWLRWVALPEFTWFFLQTLRFKENTHTFFVSLRVT